MGHLFKENRLKNRKVLKLFLERGYRVAVVGLGNEYRGDDGAGVAFVRTLTKKTRTTNRFLTIEAGRNLIRSLKEIKDYMPSGIVIVDAADLGIKQGWRVVDENEIEEKGVSTHENNITLCLHYLKGTLSGVSVIFVGIQFKCLNMTDRLKLSREVRASVNDLVRSFSESPRRHSDPSDFKVVS
jgi:hydrogenase maturation protease